MRVLPSDDADIRGAAPLRVGRFDLGELQAGLTSGVQAQEEGEVLARYVARRGQCLAVVFVRSEGEWSVCGSEGLELPDGAALVEVDEPRAWATALLPGWSWWATDLFHGRRRVGCVLTSVPDEGGLAAVCAVAAPFFAARRPRVSPPRSFELYLAQIVHDLRRPLTTLSLSVQLLEKPGAADRELRVSRCRRAVQQLRQLVDDLLLFSTPAPHDVEPVSLVHLLGELASDLGDDAERRRVHFQLQIEAQPCIVGDLVGLERAFGNLLSNAVEHSPEGAAVEIRVALEADEAVVEIRDGGPGVPAELRERVFHPFFTTRTGGNGLGLAVTRLITQAHGGTVGFLEGPGGVVRVRLPTARIHASHKA